MTVRMPIQVMSPDLALKIAAGEVVERPASAVRELLDNALDAGAKRIAVEVEDAGLKTIRVVDDGAGMPRDELALAFRSHATSKIRDLDDLQRLSSLGFRGEALPSIAAISRVEVQTRTEEEATGTRFSIAFGEPAAPSPCAAPRGTRITVSDLFSNVPARRTFVRSLRAEGGQIAGVVMRHALAHPDVQFTLALDGVSTFSSPGSGRLEDVAPEVFGAVTSKSLMPVFREEQGIVVEGMVGKPNLSRQNRSLIHIFVNGRSVANRSLIFALTQAFSGFLMSGRYPVAAVHLTVPPNEVDPNIHPSKSEVRFAREREVHGALHRAVEAALTEHRFGENRLEPVTTNGDQPSSADEQIPFGLLQTLDQVQAAIPEIRAMPALRIFGQANATFIVAEGPSGLYMIDQHAAHERVLFDRFDAELEVGDVSSQSLLEPAPVELNPGQIEALEVNAGLLKRAGFDLEPFGSDACLVRSVPTAAARTKVGELVSEVLTELENLSEPGAARERALAALACKAAVKAGASLDVEEMRELVTQLESTARPTTCPHGRPTMIHLSHTQLEREFGRR
jgi:DNA mismatch repair protein MutL